MDAVAKASAYYLDPVSALLRAIVQAEGGEEAFTQHAIKMTPRPKTFEEALARAAKTLRGRIIAYCNFCLACDGMLKPLFVLEKHIGVDPFTGEETPRCLAFSPDFLRFLGSTFAPIGAENDPTELNKYWIPNVDAIYRRLLRT